MQSDTFARQTIDSPYMYIYSSSPPTSLQEKGSEGAENIIHVHVWSYNAQPPDFYGVFSLAKVSEDPRSREHVGVYSEATAQLLS